MLTTRSQRLARIASTTASPFSSVATSSPAPEQRPRVPAVASSRKPSAGERLGDRHDPALSACRTERNAVPVVGSGRPAARSALANAVGRSAALAITSPVERISGPSTGSEPGKREKGSTAALTLTSSGGRSSRQLELVQSARPAASRTAASTRLTPVALLANGTVRDARGLTSSTETSPSDERELDVQQADDAECRAEAADDAADLRVRLLVERGRREDARRVAGVDAGFLDVLHHGADVHRHAVAERVDVDLERTLEEAVDEHGPVTPAIAERTCSSS